MFFSGIYYFFVSSKIESSGEHLSKYITPLCEWPLTKRWMHTEIADGHPSKIRCPTVLLSCLLTSRHCRCVIRYTDFLCIHRFPFSKRERTSYGKQRKPVHHLHPLPEREHSRQQGRIRCLLPRH